MKKIVFALLTTLSAVVLLFSYRTSTAAVLPTGASGGAGTSGGGDSGAVAPDSSATSSSGASASSGGSSASSSGSSGSSSSSTGSAAASGLKDGTFTGSATRTRYGPVQVRITVSGGRITAVKATEYPSSSGEDQAINSYAIPILDQEAVSAQSASIDMVSGATYTSQGYLTSLQSALDQAKA